VLDSNEYNNIELSQYNGMNSIKIKIVFLIFKHEWSYYKLEQVT
jgi:GTP1/Obg family GTP-binding protein